MVAFTRLSLNSVSYVFSAVISTTDKNASGTIENLYLGEYYWQEISPSEGYELDETKYPFTASYKDQNTITITVDKTVKETIRTGEFDLIKVITDGSKRK